MAWNENMTLFDSLVERNMDDSFFFGPVTDDEITRAENLLSVRFPDSYRYFLKKYGVGNYADVELYGIIHNSVPGDSAPCAVWFTLEERKNPEFPPDFVVLYASGYGPLYCLATSETVEGDCPVREWNYKKVARDESSLISEEFSQFVLNKAQERSV